MDSINHMGWDMSMSKLWEIVKDRKPAMLQSTGSQTAGHDLVTEQKILKIKNQEEQKTLLKLKSNDDKLILTFFKCKYYKVMISFVVIGQE